MAVVPVTAHPELSPAGSLEAALRYAAAGWPVFPCRPGRKEPMTRHGLHDASTSPAVIRRWWHRHPPANVAIATGAPGPDVLDVDVRHVDGMPAFGRLRRAGLLGGALATVRTPSGGLHVYYRGTDQPNGCLRRHGVDFRGRGGYVLAPPSVVDGAPYVLIDVRHGARGRALGWAACRGLVDPPRQRTAPRQVSAGGIAELARWLAHQPAGGRNNSLYWAACRAVEGGHGDQLDELVAAAVAAGLDEREARRTVESAARRLGVAS